MNRKLPLDPKLGLGADARLVQLLSDAARVTRDLQEQIDALSGLVGVTASAAEINVLDGLSGLISGTYTPTISNIANATSLAATDAQYLRVGDVVTVSGKFTLTTTDATTTTVELTLPVASTFTQDYEAAGVVFIAQPGGSPVQSTAKVFSQNTGTKARVEWRANVTSGSVTGYYTYTYQVI